MKRSKLVKANEQIAAKAVNTFAKIESAAVAGYGKIETAFVARYLTHEGETPTQAKARLQEEQRRRMEGPRQSPPSTPHTS